MTNTAHTVLYVGITSNLPSRVEQHRSGHGSRFTSRYKATQLVYCEECTTALNAIAREKQIKAGSRAKKIARIESMNPRWQDLTESVIL